MSAKLVKLQSGYLDGEGEEKSPEVYERPVMLVYTGKFDSMDGPVEITPAHILLLANTHNATLAKLKRMITGDIPMRECPPLQLDHSVSAKDTVGRLVGELSHGEVEIEGDKRQALFGIARFLGRENVEKARDGRWTNVSIGADLETGKLNELSITPFPAAPKASLLCRMSAHNGVDYKIEEVKPGEYDIYVGGQKVSHHAGTAADVESEAKRYIEEQKKETVGMHEKLKKHLMDAKKMSEADAEKMSKECLAHHMKHMGMDEEKMGKHMAEAKDEDIKKMSDEYDTAMKKLAEKGPAAGDEGTKDANMAAARTAFVKLSKGLKVSVKESGSDIRMAGIGSRIARLRASGRMTPAEIKKLDVAKLSSLSQEAVDAAFAMAENRDPVVKLGLVHGTTKAATIDAVSKKYRMARMELESRLNMPSKREEAQKMLSSLNAQEKAEMAAVGGGDEEAPSKGMLTKVSFEDLCAMLDDKKRHEELRKHLRHLSDHYGIGPDQMSGGEEGEKKMSAVAKRQEDIQNQLNELITLAAPILGIKLDELN